MAEFVLYFSLRSQNGLDQHLERVCDFIRIAAGCQNLKTGMLVVFVVFWTTIACAVFKKYTVYPSCTAQPTLKSWCGSFHGFKVGTLCRQFSVSNYGNSIFQQEPSLRSPAFCGGMIFLFPSFTSSSPMWCNSWHKSFGRKVLLSL